MSVYNIDQALTIGRIIKGLGVTIVGAVASTAPELQKAMSEIHWLQIVVWVGTAFAAFATGTCAIIRLCLDWKKRPAKK